MSEKLRKKLSERFGEDMLYMDGFDDCIIGIAERCGMEPVVVYSRSKVLRKLEKQGMDGEEAADYHYNNQAGAYMGEKTPLFFDDLGDILQGI
jgi:hypothetical protein